MKTLRIISRYLIGLTFIFSGFVKGQDPLGTSFRIEDYFIAYGMDWAIPASLFLSVLLCAAEFGLGWALIWNALTKGNHLSGYGHDDLFYHSNAIRCYLQSCA